MRLIEKIKADRHARTASVTSKVTCGFGEVSLALITMSQGVLVKQIFCHASFRGSHLAQVGHVVTQFLDGFHLLIQVMCLNEVTQLGKRTWDKVIGQLSQALWQMISSIHTPCF